ncbi:MAG TPA: UDP-N-acetylmuramoyl-L-alanyl-D-glutamate--2,6-diaminopimelate ligase [Solirubrobacterales bacterium]|nr:UDP-N-acetylmuramoyl-L-alanyl-D-glutamate--2,6-diaminopimelate ligase [Solirubrobacterales bacterium]
MTLRDLIAAAGDARLVGEDEVEISALALDSRRVAPGTLYFAVPGLQRDGHEFAPTAVEAGAAAIVCERELGLGVPEVVVASSRDAMAPLAARFYGEPSRELPVVAITGTNGKTTTAWLLREILAAERGSCGLIGTVKRLVGGVEEEAERTTPEAIELQGALRRMIEAGDRACVIEASSHALEQRRCEATEFAAAVFTNLTRDHLDHHGGMEPYFLAKRRLFELAPGAGVVNLDDEYGRRLAEEFPDSLTYSAASVAGGSGVARDAEEGSAPPAADLRAEEVSFDATGARFVVVEAGGGGADDRPASGGGANQAAGAPERVAVTTALPGAFNVANALAAIAAARRMGVSLAAAAAALAGAGRVPGRFEPIEAGQDFTVLVDYAHTPDSVANALQAARRLTDGSLITVVGAGGDRDRGKRPEMGLAASAGSDHVVFTSDNPRSEDPAEIVAAVAAGAEPGGATVETVVDRREAISRALKRAGSGDVVVIAGKGHEQGQEFAGGKRLPFDDRLVAAELLEELARG